MKGNIGNFNRKGGEGGKLPRVGKRVWAGAAVAAVVALTLIIVFTRRRPEPENIPVVQTQTVQTQDVEVYGEYPGTIRAQQFVEVRARVEG